jgi:hypothetical protein
MKIKPNINRLYVNRMSKIKLTALNQKRAVPTFFEGLTLGSRIFFYLQIDQYCGIFCARTQCETVWHLAGQCHMYCGR